MSKCAACGESKTRKDFPSYSGGRCRECYNAHKRTLPSYTDKNYQRNLKLQARYGISLDEYEGMARRQNGVCAVCEVSGKLHVDHEHETGRVRGLLCGSCNRALGLLKDNVDSLKKAIDYLSEGMN